MNTKSRMYMQMKNNFLIGAAVGGIIVYLLLRKKKNNEHLETRYVLFLDLCRIFWLFYMLLLDSFNLFLGKLAAQSP